MWLDERVASTSFPPFIGTFFHERRPWFLWRSSPAPFPACAELVFERQLSVAG